MTHISRPLLRIGADGADLPPGRALVHVLPVLLVLLLPAALLAETLAEVVAIRNVRILTVSGPPIERGTILMRGDTIADIGPNVVLPDGVRIIDGSGLTASPGLFDSYSALGLVEYQNVHTTWDRDERTSALTPHVRAVDAYNYDSVLLPLMRNAGILHVLSAPTSGNVLSGQSALMRMAGTSPEESALLPQAGMHASLTSAPVRTHGETLPSPDLQGVLTLLRQTLTDARDYASRPVEERGFRNLELQALVPVLEGRMPLIVAAHTEEQIRSAIALADDFKLRLILCYGTESYQLADELAERRIPVLLGPIDLQPFTPELRGATYRTASVLHRAGVLFAFISDEGTLVRQMVPNVGLAVAYGLPEEEALKALTLYPARIFGLDNRLGSLENGKEATLFLTTGDPLQVTSRVERIFIRGQEVEVDDYQMRLYREFIQPYMIRY